ncbi:Flavodoxin-like protein [Kitasatospora sp. MMS16-BH015]|uniref:flavodoxin family protein n=1 Tax=Kitasatospora sp. MMS16-BH015 TaxID=2018025 RepID=UPI000CA37A7D|nr:NAD(P)H-dependent oxidoreductase [Kitasatospora sp. MMS16-BH015]AUG80748.1 Flavodoxin-like protein [Kitasatospora sp. MMS16-BH015]
MINVAVIYYSATGSVHELAVAAAATAEQAGATVRLRRVAELAPAPLIASDPAWAAHAAATADLPVATLADLEWADAVLLGTPTLFGQPAAQIRQFIDTTGRICCRGKVVSSFVCATGPCGGHERGLPALDNAFQHWGAVIVPARRSELAGSADEFEDGTDGVEPVHAELEAITAVQTQTRRVLEVAGALGLVVRAAA